MATTDDVMRARHRAAEDAVTAAAERMKQQHALEDAATAPVDVGASGAGPTKPGEASAEAPARVTLSMEEAHAFHTQVAQLKVEHEAYLSRVPVRELLRDVTAHVLASRPGTHTATLECVAEFVGRFIPKEDDADVVLGELAEEAKAAQ